MPHSHAYPNDSQPARSSNDESTQSSEQQPRSPRPIKPLGTARRATRSKTPTPNDPHPYKAGEGSRSSSRSSTSTAGASLVAAPTFARTSRPEGPPSLVLGGIPALSPFPAVAPNSVESGRERSGGRQGSGFQRQRLQGPHSLFSAAEAAGSERPYLHGRRSSSGKPFASSPSASTSSTATPSGVAAAAHERRPWFPYPQRAHSSHQRSQTQVAGSANDPSASGSGSSKYSAEIEQRRTSAYSNASDASSLSSSASSYNSADLDSLSSVRRRAISADPEEWSQSILRGRQMSRMAHPDLAPSSTPQEVDEDAQPWREPKLPRSQDDSQSSSEEEEKERAHFQSVLTAFDSYLTFSLAANHARRKSFYALPRSHRLLLSSLGSALPGPVVDGSDDKASSIIAAGRGFKARLDEIDDRIRRNADVLSQIVADSRGFLGGGSSGSEDAETESDQADKQPLTTAAVPIEGVRNDESDPARSTSPTKRSSTEVRSGSKKRDSQKRAANHEVDKVRSTIKQFVRDWSAIGASERHAAYDPILESLEDTFGHVSSAQRGQVRILVPGAGLGRLAFEVAWLGFSCQGNEFSFYMLLASHFILNKTTGLNQHTIYPFIHSSSNWRTAEDMLRPIAIPDINPSDLPSHVDFSMVAGEFVEVYSKPQERAAWDAVATCFFIDTARNFARYLEVINHVLPIDGVWINVGPLLWHYEGSSSAHGEMSIELTLEEVMGLIELMGFVVEKRRTLPPQPYTGNAHSMLTYEYSAEYWQARKVRDVTPAPFV